MQNFEILGLQICKKIQESKEESINHLGMDRFHFFKKRSFRYENDDENRKTKRSFLKTIVFKNDRFKKARRFVNDR